MPRTTPPRLVVAPSSIPGTAVTDVLAAGTQLWRVHGDHAPDSFNPTVQTSILAGGRFDSHLGDYAYTYLGADPDAAVAEVIARDLPVDGPARLVPRALLRGRRLSSVTVTRDLRVLVLHGAALSQVGADLNLTKSGPDQYLHTREFAHRLLELLPAIGGFRYRCRHDEDRIAYALFDQPTADGRHRSPGALSDNGDARHLDEGEGLTEVHRVLADHNAAVEPRSRP